VRGSGRWSQIKHLRPGDYLILDNASIHSNARFRALVEVTGARLVYNAAYSPELNPVGLLRFCYEMATAVGSATKP
jgi:transposase